jgi:hypothetical protein
MNVAQKPLFAALQQRTGAPRAVQERQEYCE